jgi:hypothetical protein
MWAFALAAPRLIRPKAESHCWKEPGRPCTRHLHRTTQHRSPVTPASAPPANLTTLQLFFQHPPRDKFQSKSPAQARARLRRQRPPSGKLEGYRPVRSQFSPQVPPGPHAWPLMACLSAGCLRGSPQAMAFFGAPPPGTSMKGGCLGLPTGPGLGPLSLGLGARLKPSWPTLAGLLGAAFAAALAAMATAQLPAQLPLPLPATGRPDPAPDAFQAGAAAPIPLPPSLPQPSVAGLPRCPLPLAGPPPGRPHLKVGRSP